MSRRRGGVALAALGNRNGDADSRFSFDAPAGGFFNNEDVSTTGGRARPSRCSPAPLFLLADAGLADDIKPSYFARSVCSCCRRRFVVARQAQREEQVGRKTFKSLARPRRVDFSTSARAKSMFFKRNNYVIADAGEVITFEGNIA